jgi:hypothetical protein
MALRVLTAAEPHRLLGKWKAEVQTSIDIAEQHYVYPD